MKWEYWQGVIFYKNPKDPRLFVRKRSGLGYTLNFGNRWSWVVTALFIPLIAIAWYCQ